MKIETIYLADKATVREGLLHVLGGGLQVLYRDQLPAPMAVDLVIALTSTDVEEVRRPHGVEITIKSGDGKLNLATARVGWEEVEFVTFDPAIPAFVPLVIPLTSVGIPSHGRYSINVRLDGKGARRIDFLVAPPSAAEDALRAAEAARRQHDG